ncbi:MAG: sulfite exporter TauE/SafE family protein [Pirellula sp.]|jgi:hypothetical protein|nr:sulfite exporter TauE/SafE family protein [Pirellula sp.]
MSLPLTLLFGGVVGLSLGMTGGGGAIFAVPMLVYGLQVPARESIAISLAAVGATAMVGFVRRLKEGGVEVVTGLLFAVAGMVGAPAGTWIASRIPDRVLLLLFAGLMLVVAIKMWMQATKRSRPKLLNDLDCKEKPNPNPTCQRDDQGRLLLSSRCAMLLMVLGVATGILSGMFGVGGGFIIVPALVLFSGMSMHRAIGTSLLVVALVSGSGLISQWTAGTALNWTVTGLFVAGGLVGLFLGQSIASKMKAETLQRVFAVAIILVACFVVARNVSA